MSQRSKGLKKNDDALDRETLAQGDIEVEAGRRAGWAVLSTNRVFAAGTRTTTLFGGITDQHWVGKVDAQALQKP